MEHSLFDEDGDEFYSDGVAANGDWVGMGLKLMGMEWGRGNF